MTLCHTPIINQTNTWMSGWTDRYTIFEKQALNYVDQVKINDFEHSTYCSFHKNYFYGESPKTGCSTIKRVLIQAEMGKRIDFEHSNYIHYREFNPFLKISQVGNLEEYFQREDLFKFCFVRNPYTRLLSCYLDKIQKDQFQNRQIKIQLGRRPDSQKEITFNEFVDSVIKQPVMFMDQHWRTQYYQTFQSNIDYDFIGKFENFEEDLFFVLDQLAINREKYYDVSNEHATNADELIQKYYTKDIAEKVYRKYEIDFEYFGYQKSLT